jgi:hypothetical protein
VSPERLMGNISHAKRIAPWKGCLVP